MMKVSRGVNIWIKANLILDSNTTVNDILMFAKEIAAIGIPGDTKVRHHRDGGSTTILTASHTIEKPHPEDE